MQNEARQFRSWAEVSSSEKFLSLSPEHQERARELYYQDTVAPRVPKGMESRAREMFDRDTMIISQDVDLETPGQESNQSDGKNIITDAGNLLAGGVNRAAQNVRELVGRIPVVGEGILNAGDAVDSFFHGKDSETLLRENEKRYQGNLTQETQDAQAKLWWDSENKSLGPAWKDPRAYASGIIQSLPEMTLTMGPSGRLAKAAYTRSLAKTGSRVMAAKAAAKTATIAGGIGEGLLGGADTARNVRDKINEMPLEKLANSEAFQSLIDEGMSPEDARRNLAEDSATQGMMIAGVATGIFGGLGDRALAKMLTGSIKSGVAGRVTKGAVSEGFFEELPQSISQGMAENYAVQAADPTQELTEGVLNEGLGGLATGGVMGGGLGAIATPRANRESSPAPTNELESQEDATFENTPESLAIEAPGLQGLLPEPEQTFYADSEGVVQDVGPVRNVDGTMQPSPQSQQWVNPANRTDAPADLIGGAGMELQTPRGAPAGLEGQFIQGQEQQPMTPPESTGLTLDGNIERLGLPEPEAFVVDSEGNAQRGATAPQVFNEPPMKGGAGMDQQAPTAPPRQQKAAPKAMPDEKSPQERAQYSWDSMNTFERNKAAQDTLGYADADMTEAAAKAWDQLAAQDQQKLADAMDQDSGQRWDVPNQKISDKDRPVLQNRDRSTDASIAQMQDIKNNPDYDRLSVSRDFGNGAPVVEPGADFPAAQLGRSERTTTSTGRKIPVQYAVVEADQLLPSNDALGNSIPEYANGVEGKSRAIAGNGRVAGITAAWKSSNPGKAEAYKKQMIEDTQHGIDPEVIRDMKQPVLVRIMPLEEVSNNIGDESNVSGQAGLSPTEQANTDMRRIDLAELSLTEDNELSENTVLDFIKGMPKSELGTLLTKSGRPTPAAYARAEAALFQQAYQNEALTENLVDLKGDAKFIMNALMRAAPAMAKLEGAGIYDIRPLVSEAAEVAVNARRQGIKLSEFVKMGDFGRNPQVMPILEMMIESGQRTTAIGDKLINLAQMAYTEANKAGQDMFGEVDKQSPEALMKKAFDGEKANAQEIDGTPETLGDGGRSRPDASNAEGRAADGEGQSDSGAVQADQPAKPETAEARLKKKAAEKKASTEPATEKWRKNYLLAKKRATELGIDPKEHGKLPGLVRAIDAAIAEKAKPEAPALDLTQQTEETLAAEAERLEQLQKEEATQKAKQKAAENKARERDADKARADEVVDDFQLGQPAEDAMSGMGDIFDSSPSADKPDAETKAKDAEAQAAQPAPAPIEDAGEKLGGARKDELRTVRERLDDMSDEAIASSKLSELWPKGEVDRITDPFHAAAYYAVRAYIPTKPRATYRVKRWVDQVKAARGLLQDLADIGADASVAKMRETSPSLNILADQIELLMGIDRAHWSRVSDAKIRSGRYNQDGEMVPGSWVELKIDKRGKSFYGHESIASALPAINQSLDSKPVAEKKQKFSIYTRTATGEVFISADADKERRALKSFENTGEARKYLGDHHGDLVAAWEAVKNRENVTKSDMRRNVNEARVGQDYRGGKDVTPEQFLDQFGFRGVEFGNWVKQGKGGQERQGILNDAYDAFMDLAGVVGVPPKALSLEGRLGIGFGSRGRGGSHAAHYEPGRMVINLTKTKGAGSLAHEWFHAMDNYFAHKRGVPEFKGDNDAYRKGAFVTYRPEPIMVRKDTVGKRYRLALTRAELALRRARSPDDPQLAVDAWVTDPEHKQGVRPVVEKAFAELVQTLDASPMTRRSSIIDKGKVDGYWSQIIERGARAFETYVIARLADQGARNDYLANVQTLEEFSRDPGRYPYLTPDEQGPVNEAFDKLFNTIESRETDSGVQLYKANKKDGATGVKADAITDALASTPELAGVKVVQSFEDLPEQARKQAEIDGVDAGDISGIYFNGTSYVVADNHSTVAEAVRTAVHEEVGHRGIRGLLGDKLAPTMERIYSSMAATASGRKLIKDMRADYGHLRDKDQRQAVSEELVAHLLETGDKPTLVRRFVSKVRELLRAMFPQVKWTNLDVLALGEQSRAWLRRDMKPEKSATGNAGTFSADTDDIRFSFAGQRSETADHYSLGSAQQRIESGENAEAVRQDTGWHKGIDGKWRYEISDHDAKLRKPFPSKGQLWGGVYESVNQSKVQRGEGYGISLGEILDHPALFAAYPHLADLSVSTQKGSGASYESGSPSSPASISIGTDVPMYDVPSKLLHEIQHGIQFIEGFALGGNSSANAYTRLAGEIEARNTQSRQNMTAEQRKSTPPSATQDVSDADAIVMFNGTEMHNAPAPVNTGTNPDIRYSLKGKNKKHTSESFNDLTDKQKAALNKIAPLTTQQKAAEWFRDKTDRALLKIRQGLVDRFAALREIDEAAYGENILSVDITNSSWVLARMSSAASGALHAMLNNGRIYLDQKQKVIDIQDGDSLGLGATLARLGSPAEIERFMGWIAGNRSARLAAEGRENLFSADDIDALKTLNKGKTESGKARKALYDDVFKEFQQYRDDVLAIAEQTGIITAENRALWRDEFYVPFYRVMDEDAKAAGPGGNKGLTRQEAYKKLKGGKQNLNDLLQNTMLNFNHLLTASLKNQAAAQALSNAEQIGVAEKTTESARDKKASTFVLVDGKQQWYNIDDPLVFEALSMISDGGLNTAAVKVMSAFKRVFTNMTTITPQFIIANLLRDSMQATATSPVSKNFLKNIVAGGKDWTDGKKRARMMATGGAFSFGHIYNNDPHEMKAHLTRNLKSAQLLSSTKLIPTALRAGWDAWNATANAAENANRAAIFSQNEKSKGKLAAAFEARDLMDFSMHGAWPAVRFLIRVIPFLNARLQGLDKLHRSGVKPTLLTAFGKGNASDKQAMKRFLTVAGAISAASMALMLVNNDDEEYRKLEEWQKDTYWFVRVGDKAFFIPKPFEVGVIATMAERLLQQGIDDKATGELFKQRLGHALTETFAFSVVPHAFQPILDVYSNVDAFTERPIESMGMERLSKGLRSRANTTAPAHALSAVSRALGDDFPLAVSPVQADHLIAGYLGQVGAWGAGLVDTMWRTAKGETRPARHWHEYQPIRRFYKDLGTPNAYTRYSTLFYEGLRESGKVYADVMELQRSGKEDQMRETINKNRDILGMRKNLNRAQRDLSKINDRIGMVRIGPLDADEKRREIDRLTVIKSRITEAAGKQVEAMKAAR